MSGRVGEDKIAEVRERTSIVEIVSRYTALKRTGRNHQGLCPFHSEKTPSFSVSEERGVFYCFGCQASGDIFKFVMLKESLTFPEALERLAREAGVELPKRPAEARRAEDRERLLRVNAFAAKFFQQALWESPAGAPARDYLVKRSLREETAHAFGVGFAAPEGLALALEKANAPLADAESLGLIGRSTRGGWYDRFRSRLMFPITDLAEKTIAFGGRLLASVEGQPKYLNSPETPLFQKRRSVFGLAVARHAIHERQRVLLVEGYVDVIALAQAGIPNAVAPLGTALTAEQIRLLKRFTDNFLVLFDGDSAGVAAAARAFSTFAEIGVFAEAVFLPEGHDPDTFVNERGGAAMEDLLKRSSPLVDHYLRSLAPPDAALAVRARAAQTIAELCDRIDDPSFAGLLRRRAADYLRLAEDELRKRAPRQTPERAAPPRTLPQANTPDSLVIELLLVHPELLATLPPQIHDLLPNEGARALLSRIRSGEPPTDLVRALSREAADRVARAWLGDSAAYAVPERMLAECVATLSARARDLRRRALTQEIAEAERRGDEASLRALVEEKRRLDAAGAPAKAEKAS